jgi:hypothetical protein
MASSYLNIITFLLTTVFYYLSLKPSLKYQQLVNASEYKQYIQTNNLYLVIYFLLVLVIQFIVNTSIITTKCGGNISKNMGPAGTLTFIPWFLIFGVVIIVVLIFPGFKSAFSDVVGYYYVSSATNKLLTELLINTKVNEQIEKSTGGEIISIPEGDRYPNASAPPINIPEEPIKMPAVPQGTVKMVGGATKKDMEAAADMIIKICGNTAIIINQMVPTNFVDYWNTLKPLMKDKYQSNEQLLDKKRDELFELVVTRDNVGEAMWYIYTGLLITSITQLKIANRSCNTDPKEIAKNYQNYLEKQAEENKKVKQATSTVYTLTN